MPNSSSKSSTSKRCTYTSGVHVTRRSTYPIFEVSGSKNHTWALGPESTNMIYLGPLDSGSGPVLPYKPGSLARLEKVSARIGLQEAFLGQVQAPWASRNVQNNGYILYVWDIGLLFLALWRSRYSQAPQIFLESFFKQSSFSHMGILTMI